MLLHQLGGENPQVVFCRIFDHVPQVPTRPVNDFLHHRERVQEGHLLLRGARMTLGMFFFCVADAQEDLESLLDELAPLPPQEVMATFKSGKVINLHTNERVAAGNLEMRISHRFGSL